jgi:hypothetical protein
MRYTVLFSILLFFILAGCKKDSFKTTPGLSFTKVNTTELLNGQNIQFTLSFTDAEGDIVDSIFVEKIVADCPGSSFDQLYPIPDFPTTKDQKGDIVITFGYNTGFPQVNPQCGRTETAIFRFALNDAAGNTSDTISSPPITIVY